MRRSLRALSDAFVAATAVAGQDLAGLSSELPPTTGAADETACAAHLQVFVAQALGPMLAAAFAGMAGNGTAPAPTTEPACPDGMQDTIVRDARCQRVCQI